MGQTLNPITNLSPKPKNGKTMGNTSSCYRRRLELSVGSADTIVLLCGDLSELGGTKDPFWGLGVCGVGCRFRVWGWGLVLGV